MPVVLTEDIDEFVRGLIDAHCCTKSYAIWIVDWDDE
jgi:hypothetical protein